MTTAEHLVVLTVMGAEGQAVPYAALVAEFGAPTVQRAGLAGPLYMRWRFPDVVDDGGRLVPDPTAVACPSGPPFTEVYYGGADARRAEPCPQF